MSNSNISAPSSPSGGEKVYLVVSAVRGKQLSRFEIINLIEYKQKPILCSTASNQISEANIPCGSESDVSSVGKTITEVVDPEDIDIALKIITSQAENRHRKSSGSNQEKENSRSHIQNVQFLVAAWAMAFTTMVVASAVIRWCITPAIDIGPYLRSGVLTPAMLAVGAVVAWSFKSTAADVAKKSRAKNEKKSTS